MKYQFQPQQSLRKKDQFRRLFRCVEHRIVTDFFNIYFNDNRLIYSRLGVIVPKKNIRKATARNSFKRIIRESFRLRQHNLKPKDILVVANKKAGFLTKKELAVNWKKQLEEL